VLKISNINKETSLYENGFLKTKLRENFNFSELVENIKNIQTNSDDQILGYSTNIYDRLDESNKANLTKLANKFLRYEIVKRYLKIPLLLKIMVLKSKFNIESLKNPTHAMLWHRDLDDVFSQLKLIIPLNLNDTENGAFSVASKKIAPLDLMLVDKKLQDELELSNNDYKKEDKFRVSDLTFKKYYRDYIYEHKGDATDLLFVDTNKCYHKGGQVIKEDRERYTLFIHIGQPTNFWHPLLQLKKKNIYSYIYIVFVKFVRLFMKLYFSLLNKKFNSKKKFLY
jgi:hypothetical protein